MPSHSVFLHSVFLHSVLLHSDKNPLTTNALTKNPSTKNPLTKIPLTRDALTKNRCKQVTYIYVSALRLSIVDSEHQLNLYLSCTNYALCKCEGI